MSEQESNGGQAFPGRVFGDLPGMSLRDWFAGQALPAIIAATGAGQHNPVPPDAPRTPADIDAGMARNAYELADAMLAARAKA